MKTAVLIIVTFGLATASAADADKLQGNWIAVSAERDGKPAADIKGHMLTIDGDRFTIKLKDKVLYRGTIKVDEAKSPATIDFLHATDSLQNKSWHGIFELAGNTLKICDNGADLNKKRPTAFRTEADSGHVLVTFKRE